MISQKNPAGSCAELITTKSPPEAANIGRDAAYTTSGMNAASSITSKSAVNPRIVGAEHGNPTIVDPFGNRTECEFDPSPVSRWNPNFRSIHLHLSISSVDCRFDAATTTTLNSGFVNIRCTANPATAVLLPHCRAPTRAFRLDGVSTNSSCH